MAGTSQLTPALRLLSSGVDSLYWSARCDGVLAFPELGAIRDDAAAVGQAAPWRSIQGFALSVLPHGAVRYPVVLDCHEFRLHITDSVRLPTLWVQLRSAFIHEVGVESAGAESVVVASEVVGAAVSVPHASRDRSLRRLRRLAADPG